MLSTLDPYRISTPCGSFASLCSQNSSQGLAKRSQRFSPASQPHAASLRGDPPAHIQARSDMMVRCSHYVHVCVRARPRHLQTSCDVVACLPHYWFVGVGTRCSGFRYPPSSTRTQQNRSCSLRFWRLVEMGGIDDTSLSFIRRKLLKN